MLTDLAPEIRQTIRALRRRPGFTALVVTTLALGLGATITLFSVVRGVLLQPLPFPHAERIVRLLGTKAGEEGYDTISYPNLQDWRHQSRSFTAMSAYDEWTPFLLGGGAAEQLAGASVNASFFAVLGVQPAAGRFFLASEDVPGSTMAVVLSHGLWQRRFGSDPRVVGRQLALSGKSYQIVGVAPASLEDPGLSDGGDAPPEIWRVSPAYFGDGASRDGFAFAGVGRLRAGVALGAAQADVGAIMANLDRLYPKENEGRGVRLERLQDHIVAPARPALLALLAATALLLVVASANVASLLLTRSLSRRGELAVRRALGAERGDLLRATLLESLLLAVIGGGLGLLLAGVLTPRLLAMADGAVPRLDRVGMDARVVGFALALSLLTAVLVAVAPILRLRRTQPAEALRGSRQTADAQSQHLRSTILAFEVGLCVVLLVSAGLVLRTFLDLRATDPGFRPQGVLAAKLQAPYPKYADDASVVALWDRLQRRLGALPGVIAAGTIDILPMDGNFNGMGFTVAGRPAPADGHEPSVETRVVSPGFFAAAGLPLRRGRLLAERDGAATLALVDEAMARRFFPGQDPIGQRLVMDKREWEIVGVVGSIRQFALGEAPRGALYLPRAAAPSFASSGGYLLLRTSGDPAALGTAVRAATREVDPDVVITDLRPFQRVVAATAARIELQAALLLAFAALATLIGCVGVYGLVAAGVAARRRELAVRAALGAERLRLLRLVVAEGLLPVVLGAGCGLVAAFGAGRLLGRLIAGVRAPDPFTFTAATALLLAVATLAACLPARGAANADPARILREE